MEQNKKTVLDWALEYAALGWHIFPVHGIDEHGHCTCGKVDCEDAGKHPVSSNGLRAATTDSTAITQWFSDGRYNIALRTGEVSGVTVLDIDIGAGKQGAATWGALTAAGGEPATLVAQTGSGGAHFFFRYNSALNTSSNTLGPGVDCRNNKGYVVVAPSKHRSGGQYSWAEWDPSLIGNLPAHLTKRVETRGRKRKDDPTKKKYSIDEVAKMLEHIPPDDRDMWRNVGVILGREFVRSDAAWKAYNAWSDKWGGAKGRNHDAIMRQAFYEESAKAGDLSLGTIVHHALSGGWAPETGKIDILQFVFYSPQANYIYRPTADHWPSESVDALVSKVNDNGQLVKATEWLKRNRFATSLTSDPDLDEHVHGIDMKNGSIVVNPEGAVYNTYSPPKIALGDARLAKPFLDHVRRLLPREGDAEQFLNFMAHRVQRPGEKPRFALLIAGEQGVGKDTIITMCGPAIGEWNCVSIPPSEIDSKYNDYAKYVLINISEAANHAEMTKWAFNEQMKTLIAGNPDNQLINEKYGRKYHVRLHCGVVLTTNHMTNGLYIPADDRRYDVMECASREEMGLADPYVRGDYFARLWAWYNEEEGAAHIAAYLHERELGKFSASTGQRITAAHQKIVQTGMSGDEWIIDCLLELATKDDKGQLVTPAWTTSAHVLEALKKTAHAEMPASNARRSMANALARQGFNRLICAESKDGRWALRGADGKKKYVTVYYDMRKAAAADVVRALDTAQLPQETW